MTPKKTSHGLVGRCCISTKDLYDNITCNLSGVKLLFSLGIGTPTKIDMFFSKKNLVLEGSVFRFQPLVLGEFIPWVTIKLTFSLLRFKSTSLVFKNGPIHFAVFKTCKLHKKSGSNTFAKVLKQICKLVFLFQLQAISSCKTCSSEK